MILLMLTVESYFTWRRTISLTPTPANGRRKLAQWPGSVSYPGMVNKRRPKQRAKTASS